MSAQGQIPDWFALVFGTGVIGTAVAWGANVVRVQRLRQDFDYHAKKPAHGQASERLTKLETKFEEIVRRLESIESSIAKLRSDVASWRDQRSADG